MYSYHHINNTNNNDPFSLGRARKNITKGVIFVTEVPRAQITK